MHSGKPERGPQRKQHLSLSSLSLSLSGLAVSITLRRGLAVSVHPVLSRTLDRPCTFRDGQLH